MPRTLWALPLALLLLLSTTTCSEAKLGKSVIVDFIQLLQGYLRSASPMSHQVAAKHYAGMCLAAYQGLKTARRHGVDHKEDAAVVAYACQVYLNDFFPNSTAHNSLAESFMTTCKDPAGVSKWAAKGGKKICAKTDMKGFAPVPAKLPDPVPGVYRLLPGQANCTYPSLGDSKAFVLSERKCKKISDEHAAVGQAYFKSDAYYKDIKTVEKKGCAANSTRSAYEQQTPAFWADMAGTSFAAGHFLDIAIQALPASTGLEDQVFFFAMFTAAMSDASIPCFKVKYTVNLWRPFHAITLGDDSPACQTDPTWQPYMAVPTHPSFPSGHSCISGAATQVLRAWLKTDSCNITIGSEGLKTAPPRHFTTFSAISEETGWSRVLGGLHYPFDCHEGVQLGADVAKAVCVKMGLASS